MENKVKDHQLQKQLRADDKTALQQLYVAYKMEFINYAKRYTLDEQDVLDIYQDAVIAMHQNFVMKQVTLESSTVKTYLFGIAKHKVFKKLKEEQRLLRVHNIPDDTVEIDLNEDEPSAQQKALAKKISEISESCQTLLKLFYYRNLTIDEIVEQTDYKDGNSVRSHKSRCLKRLKTFFNTK